MPKIDWGSEDHCSKPKDLTEMTSFRNMEEIFLVAFSQLLTGGWHWLVSELFQILPHFLKDTPYIFGSVSIFLHFIEVSVILDLCLSKFLSFSFIILKILLFFLTRFHSEYQKIRISETPTVFRENHILWKSWRPHEGNVLSTQKQ